MTLPPGLETQPQTFDGVFSLTLPYIYDFSTSFSEGWRAGNASQVPENPVGGMPNVRSYSDIGYQILWWLTELQSGESQKFVSQSLAQSCFVAEFCVLLWVLTLPSWNGDNVMVLGQEHGITQIWWQEKRKGNSLSLVENNRQWTA